MIAETAFRSEEQFTQEEFRRWVERRPAADINRYELIHGRIVMTPPAAAGHASIGAHLCQLLNQHVRRADLGTVFDSSAGYELPSGDTVEPDVSFVSRERLAAGPVPDPDQFLQVVPTLVTEILSPSTARRDQTEKKEIYERNGVDEYWIVDRSRRQVTVFQLVQGRYAPAIEIRTGRIRSRVLPRLHLAAEKLFAD